MFQFLTFGLETRTTETIFVDCYELHEEVITALITSVNEEATCYITPAMALVMEETSIVDKWTFTEVKRAKHSFYPLVKNQRKRLSKKNKINMLTYPTLEVLKTYFCCSRICVNFRSTW